MSADQIDLIAFARALIASRGDWPEGEVLDMLTEAARRLARDGVRFTLDGQPFSVLAPTSDEVLWLLARRLGVESRTGVL